MLDALLRSVLTHCFSASVASVYSFHSFRSGLACALYASKCPDAMIQLLCRWMNPASLRLYRRMTPGQYEELIRNASTVDITSIQTSNIPRVSGDVSFATINGWECPPADLLRLFDAARVGTDADSPIGTVQPPAKRSAPAAPPVTPQRAKVPRPPCTPPALTHASLRVGSTVTVDSRAYPDEACNENDGRAYSGTVTSVTAETAKITFTKISPRTKTNYKGNVKLSLLQVVTY